jgi:cytoskeleton protein RodZ
MMELQEIGDLLRRERQKQGLSVDELMERTKISRRVILAIEEGQQSGLPHPVYAKGFVKTYAGILGLDPEEVGRAFSSIYGIEDDAPMTGPLALAEHETRPSRIPAIGKAIAAVLVLSVGVIVALSLLRGGHVADEAVRQAPAAVEQKAQAAPAPVEPTPRAEESAAPAADNAPSEPSAPVPPTPAGQAAFPSTAEPVAPAVEERAPQRATNVLVLSAFQQCWVRASIDGRPVERFLQPGQQMSLNFTISLSVRLGNAGGVRLTYNEVHYPLNAQPGEVRLLTFP